MVVNKVLSQFSTYRGLAIKSLLREIVYNDLFNKDIIKDSDYGMFFNRNHSMEVDLVIKAKSVITLGSFKWKNTKFKMSDKEKLVEAVNSQYFNNKNSNIINHNNDIILIGVSKAGFDKNLNLDYQYTQKDILDLLLK